MDSTQMVNLGDQENRTKGRSSYLSRRQLPIVHSASLYPVYIVLCTLRGRRRTQALVESNPSGTGATQPPTTRQRAQRAPRTETGRELACASRPTCLGISGVLECTTNTRIGWTMVKSRCFDGFGRGKRRLKKHHGGNLISDTEEMPT
jgi:hypothetical protein